MNQKSPRSEPGSQQFNVSQSPETNLETQTATYVEILLRRKNLFWGVFLTVLLIGLAFILTRKPIYESENKLVISTRGSGSGPDDPMLSTLSGLTQGRTTSTQVEILNSEDVLTEAFLRLPVADRIRGFGVKANVHKIPLWAYRVENKTDTDVITIVGAAHDPKIAADLANMIATVYLDRDLHRNNEATHKASEYVYAELGKSQEKLAVATAELAAFKHRTGLISPPDQVTAITTRIYDLRTQIDTVHGLYEASHHRLEALHSQLVGIQPHIIATTNVMENPVFAQIASRISDLEGQRNQLRQKFTPKAREIQEIERQIKLEQESLRKTAQNIVGSTVETPNPVHDSVFEGYATEIANQVAFEAQLTAARQDLKTAEAVSEKYPILERKFAEISMRVDVMTRTYNMLSDRYYALLINEKSNLPNGLVASFAHPSDLPTSPKVVLDLVIFVFVGLFLATGIVLGFERLDTRVHDPLLVEKMTGLPNLAAIAETDPGERDRPIIGKVEANQALLEGYRILRNNIDFSTPGRELRVIAVTSPGRGDGKSTTSINLAIAMGMDGKRVLILDADLRRPSLHNTFKLPREVGLTTVAMGRIPLEQAIQITEFPNVSLLASGPLPPNPTEFLNSGPTREVVAAARELYDVVIIDAPPCAGLSDIQVIAQYVDGVILVVALDKTLKPQLHATIQTLKQVGTPMLGALLNRVQFRRSGYGYYYSYAYYYSYDYTEDAPKKSKRRTRKKKAPNPIDDPSRKE